LHYRRRLRRLAPAGEQTAGELCAEPFSNEVSPRRKSAVVGFLVMHGTRSAAWHSRGELDKLMPRQKRRVLTSGQLDAAAAAAA
jgi:heme O synthase-like polyprenyltransferase